jgi:hypothetical protein
MTSPSKSTTLAVTRRAACDRCRAQKLRCVRNTSNISAKCDRCSSAKVSCNFGVPKPAGRPPGTRRSSTEDSRMDRGSSSHSEGTAARSTLSNSTGMELEDTTMDFLTHGELCLEGPIHSDSWISNSSGILSLESSDPSIPSRLFDENALNDLSNADIIDLDTFPHPLSEDFPVTYTHQMSSPGTPQSGAIRSHPSIQPSRSNLPDLLKGIPTLGICPPPNVHDNGIYQSGFTLTGGCPDIIRGDERSEPNQMKEHVESRLAPDQHRIKQLSELNMSLYYLSVQSNDLKQEIDQSVGLSNFPDKFAGMLLDNSMKLLKLLRSFQDPSELGMPARPAQYHLPTDSASRSPSSDSSFGGTPSSDPPRKTNMSIMAKPCEGKTQRQTDMTVVLQLLACYLRITQLHNVFYTAIYHYITTSIQGYTQLDYCDSNSHGTKCTSLYGLLGQLHPIFPGLQIGGAPLEDFGIFQVKLVLQISTHILGEIERTLALPEGYRVSRKRNDEATGTLGVSIPIQLLKMSIMGNDPCSDLSGDHDGISGSKARLKMLRTLLKGTISI